MLATAGSSPSREASPAITPLTHVSQSLNKRRKHVDSATAGSPSPSDAGNSANATENIVLPDRHDLASRPRLTISRHPVFASQGDGTDFHTTDQIAMNRMGFRYIPAGVTPGAAIPFRTIESAPTSYRVSWEDRSPFIKVTTDGLRLLGDKGFRSARCNAPIREGRWYMEVKIEKGGGECTDDGAAHEGSHVRLGWGRREAPLNGPVGLDGYSYGIRDKTGDKVTLSRPRPYGRAFGSGDVIGMYICLPPRRQPTANDPHDPAHVKRERIAIEFKGQEYFEAVEYPQSKEMKTLMDYSSKTTDTSSVPSTVKKSATVKNVPVRGRNNKNIPEAAPLRPLPTLPDSYIAFFVNGECQGVAFDDLYDYLPLRATQESRKDKGRKRTREGLEHKENPFDDGSLGYYPSISLFNDARVEMNPGPHFKFPPPSDVDAVLQRSASATDGNHAWRPVCERYSEYMHEQWHLDAQEEKDAKSEAAKRVAAEKSEAARKAQRDKKRREGDARRRALKKAAGAGSRPDSPAAAVDDGPASRASSAMPEQGAPSTGWPAASEGLDDGRASRASSVMHEQSAPSAGWPLVGDAALDIAYSPSPTLASSTDMHGMQDDYSPLPDNGEEVSWTPAGYQAEEPDADVSYAHEPS